MMMMMNNILIMIMFFGAPSMVTLAAEAAEEETAETAQEARHRLMQEAEGFVQQRDLLPPPPLLSGHHFRVTVVKEPGFVDLDGSSSSSTLTLTQMRGGGGGAAAAQAGGNKLLATAGGYCIDIFENLARHANFTYELRPPSGLGSLCQQQQQQHDNDDKDQDHATNTNTNTSNITTGTTTIVPYAKQYQRQYLCAQSDVNDRPMMMGNATTTTTTATTTNTSAIPPGRIILPEEYATDMYLGLFYITPERQLQNHFTMSFHPPTTGALTLFGTAIRISSVEDLIAQQKLGLQRPVCVQANTAFATYIRTSFPELQIVDYDPSSSSSSISSIRAGENGDGNGDGDFYESFQSGACEIQISDNPIATRFILEQQRKQQCVVAKNGMPLGIITEPLTFGFSQYAIGVRKDMDRSVIDAMNYWMNHLMTCSSSSCDSFSQFYPQAAGTGRECGYVAFPPPPTTIADDDRWLSQGAIAGVAVGIMALVAAGFVAWHYYRIQKQRRRYKKRFVQQIARNISIGPSPKGIPAEKLAEAIQHISSRQNGIIAKDDLQKWMFDIKLNFISDKDFDALWNAIDVDGRGVVEPLEFFVFLSLCGPEFEKVYDEMSKMPKSEKLKWASRRLTNYKLRGEQGVRKMEHDLERRSRQNAAMYRGNAGAMRVLGGSGSSAYSQEQSPTEFFTNYRLPCSASSYERSSTSNLLPENNNTLDPSSAVSFQMDSSESSLLCEENGNGLERANTTSSSSRPTPNNNEVVVGRNSVMSTISEMTYSA